MKRTIIITLFMCIVWSAGAQADTSLIGKWQLIEMQKDSVIIFNRDSIELSMEARYKNELKTKDMLNQSDSLAIKNYVEFIHPMMKQMFYNFSEDGSLTAGVLDLKEGVYFFIEKSGGFMIDSTRLGISISGSIDSYAFKIEGDILTLVQLRGGDIDSKGYAKYERIKN
jgi:hypothetical protein